MVKIEAAMVLAAGKGTRLGEITKITPKPLIDLGGVTPLFLVLKDLEKAGIQKAVINCHHLGEQIVVWVQKWQKEKTFALEIVLSYEEELLETAGGIRNALPHFEGKPFVCVNADVVWRGDMVKFVKDLMVNYTEEMDFIMATTPAKYGPNVNGVCDLDEATKRFRFKTPEEKTSYAYACIMVAHPRVFEGLPKGFLPLKPVWDKSAENGKVYGVFHDEEWIDMGTPEGLEKAKNAVQEKYKGLSFEG